jgi:hypothetical protein
MAIILIRHRQCCIYDVTVFPYVIYNVDIWCCVVVGYVKCVIRYVVFIQAYAVMSAFVACRIPTHVQCFIKALAVSASLQVLAA